MDQYLVIGPDGKEFGPIDLAGLQQWIREGRVLKQTRVRKNGGAAVAAESLPEIAEVFAPPPLPQASTPPIATVVPIASEFRSWGFVAQAWQLFKPHWVELCVMFLIMFGIGAALGQIPIIGSCVGLILNAGFMVGINRAILGLLAGRPPKIEMMFGGFDRVVHAVLAAVTTILAVLAAVAPALVPILWMVFFGRVQVELVVAGAVIVAGVGTFVGGLFSFANLVIAETEHDFWTAITTSIALTRGYRWPLFGLMLVLIVVVILGVLACCVGLIAAQAIGAVTLAVVYRFLQSKQALVPVVA
jgi:uncharacterized membrane protein